MAPTLSFVTSTATSARIRPMMASSHPSGASRAADGGRTDRGEGDEHDADDEQDQAEREHQSPLQCFVRRAAARRF
jgi:hypothetical protein